jgi:hypothetical protein
MRVKLKKIETAMGIAFIGACVIIAIVSDVLSENDFGQKVSEYWNK